MVREDAAALMRLQAYLGYDRTQTHVYVAGALKNPRVPEVAALLRGQGYEVTDEWHGAGPDADACWQAYEQARGRTYPEALNGIAAQNIYLFDRAHIDLADYLVLVAPAGKSSFLELGYFLGCGKSAFVLLDTEPERYDVMPNFATKVVFTTDELLIALADKRTELDLGDD